MTPTDLHRLASRWGLPMAPEGCAAICGPVRIVSWFDRLAAYTSDPAAAEKLYRCNLGHVELRSYGNITLSFSKNHLARIVDLINPEPEDYGDDNPYARGRRYRS